MRPGLGHYLLPKNGLARRDSSVARERIAGCGSVCRGLASAGDKLAATITTPASVPARLEARGLESAGLSATDSALATLYLSQALLSGPTYPGSPAITLRTAGIGPHLMVTYPYTAANNTAEPRKANRERGVILPRPSLRSARHSLNADWPRTSGGSSSPETSCAPRPGPATG